MAKLQTRACKICRVLHAYTKTAVCKQLKRKVNAKRVTTFAQHFLALGIYNGIATGNMLGLHEFWLSLWWFFVLLILLEIGRSLNCELTTGCGAATCEFVYALLRWARLESIENDDRFWISKPSADDLICFILLANSCCWRKVWPIPHTITRWIFHQRYWKYIRYSWRWNMFDWSSVHTELCVVVWSQSLQRASAGKLSRVCFVSNCPQNF